MRYEFKKQNCNICERDEAVFIGNRNPLAFSLVKENICRIVKCKYCGLVYPNPMPIPDNEQLQANYSRAEQYFPESISEKRFKFYESILDGISTYVKDKVKLLDIGCGRGELVYLAIKRGWEAYGIDTSRSFVDYAKKHFGLETEIKLGQVKDLNFADEEFDAICLISVLQHTCNPKGLLSETNRILKKDGILFMETMNNDGLVYSMGDLYYRLLGVEKTTNLSPTFPSYQIYGFSPKSTKLICDLTGFKIVKLIVSGGRSRIKEYSKRPFREKVIRVLRDFLLIIAKWINKGQVLVVYAKKKRRKSSDFAC